MTLVSEASYLGWWGWRATSSSRAQGTCRQAAPASISADWASAQISAAAVCKAPWNCAVHSRGAVWHLWAGEGNRGATGSTSSRLHVDNSLSIPQPRSQVVAWCKSAHRPADAIHHKSKMTTAKQSLQHEEALQASIPASSQYKCAERLAFPTRRSLLWLKLPHPCKYWEVALEYS